MLGGAKTMQHVVEICSNCETETKCRRRDFSEQAWAVLVMWHEVQAAAVDRPICEHCYNELREVLIDRADEIEGILQDNENGRDRPAASGGAALPSKTATGRSKVRKVS
jgi:hypothetical protein